jgi:hypothetical protein
VYISVNLDWRGNASISTTARAALMFSTNQRTIAD